MRWFHGRWLLAAFLVLALATISGAPAADKARDGGGHDDGAMGAKDLVQWALRAEIGGQTQKREAMLVEARRRDASYAPVRWHTGHVRVGDKWVKIDDLPAVAQANKSRQEYCRLRDTLLGTAKNHLTLADFCASRGLKDEARAHLLCVLDVDPDNEAARARLGYQRVGGGWITQEELAELRASIREFQAGLAKWKPKIEALARRLERNEASLQIAEKELFEIDDPAAIPALEIVLSSRSQDSALRLVKVLSGIKGQEATAALARQAVLSQWEPVRQAAAEQLKTRPWEAFVPALLASMRTPTRTKVQSELTRGGFAMFRTIYVREAQSTVEVAVDQLAVSAYLYFAARDIAVPTIPNVPAIEAFLTRIAAQAAANENARMQWLNERLASVLSQVSGQRLQTDAKVWWDWWNKYNETLPSEKRVVWWWEYDCYTAVSVITPPTSCFVAGTTVWTIDGPRPIQKIRVGDLVLSQDPVTGEVAYKAVVKTTRRPPVELVKLTTETDAIRCTGGHPFWVAGLGWVHARKLRENDFLHAVTGAVRVAAVERDRNEETFNLVVADFNTYFVGHGKLLVHDTAPRGPTATLVPGLAAEE
ncbi:MAG: hypothetical protein HYS13_02845 [Planctomycetia bacterium]|nr:hypothetical protein [Planctomycetia bacterium]